MKMWAKENGKTIGGPSDHSVNPEYYDDTFDMATLLYWSTFSDIAHATVQESTSNHNERYYIYYN